jgi:ribonuclease HI
MTIIAAADGSALGNPGPAGWAWYVDEDNWAAGGWKHATNNQGELQAVLELFRATAHLDEDLVVMCDSQYVINSVTKWMRGWKAKGWRKADGKPVLNLEVLREIDAELAGRRYRFEWVRGHIGHELNEAADTRARAVAEAFQRGASIIPAGPGWTRGTPSATTVRAASSEFEPEPEPDEDALELSMPPTATSAGFAEPPALFTLDDPQWETITLSLTREEFARLRQRAREQGITIEELLRSLI